MKTIIGEKTRLFDKDFFFESSEDAQAALEKQNKKAKILKIMTISYIAILALVAVCDVLNLENVPGLSIIPFAFLAVWFIFGAYLIPASWKFAGRVYKIISSHFIFLPGKLLFGGTPALYLLIVFWSMPIFGVPVAYWQARLIKKAATEYINSGENSTIPDNAPASGIITD